MWGLRLRAGSRRPRGRQALLAEAGAESQLAQRCGYGPAIRGGAGVAVGLRLADLVGAGRQVGETVPAAGNGASRAAGVQADQDTRNARLTGIAGTVPVQVFVDVALDAGGVVGRARASRGHLRCPARDRVRRASSRRWNCPGRGGSTAWTRHRDRGKPGRRRRPRGRSRCPRHPAG